MQRPTCQYKDADAIKGCSDDTCTLFKTIKL